jgi:plastocyanin
MLNDVIDIANSICTYIQRAFSSSKGHKANSKSRRCKKIMKTANLIVTALVSAGLTFGVAAQAKEREHEEQTISSSDVPAAVQQAAQTEAKGGTIVRWEKEGANFEAVIEKNGKRIGVEMDANGKVVSRHDEAKEHKEKGEKAEKH